MDLGYPAARIPAEYDTGRPEPELGQVHPEDVGIIVVIRMERKPLIHSGDRAQPPKHEPTTTDEHLGSGADRQPGTRIRQPAGEPIPTADLAPHLRVVRNIGADHLVRHAERMPEQPHDFTGQPQHREPGTIRERDHAHPVVGNDEDLRGEARKNPAVLHSEMPADVDA